LKQLVSLPPVISDMLNSRPPKFPALTKLQADYVHYASVVDYKNRLQKSPLMRMRENREGTGKVR